MHTPAHSPFIERILSCAATGVAACLLLVVLSGCFGQQPTAKTDGETETEIETEAGTVLTSIAIDAPGWSKNSSPFVVHFVGIDEAARDVDFCHAVSADDAATADVELPAGSYEVGYISAINPDGSIYRTPEEPTTVVIGETAGKSAPTSDDASPDAVDEQPTFDVDGSFERVPAENVTQDDIDTILGDLAAAVEKGDETLSGDAGKNVVDTATENAQNAPNVDKDEVAEKGAEAGDAVKDEPTKPSTTGSGNAGTGDSEPASKPSGGSDGNSGGSSNQPSKPAHQHTWVAQTEQQWVVDEAAWDEPVYEARRISVALCEGCGESATFDNSTDASNWTVNHLVEHQYDDDRDIHTPHYYNKTEYVQTGTVHHDEVGHWETVTTGYTCSGCGATR